MTENNMRGLPLILLLAVACRTKDVVIDSGPVAGDDSTAAVDGDGDGFDADDDCDDADPAVNPDSVEVCDGVDNDCDGQTDEGVTSAFFADADADGYGDEAQVEDACEAPDGYVAQGGDCDDSDPAYNPGAAEDDCADPNDYNCDGSTGYADGDGDGFAACEECDDADAAIHPDASEVCDDVDNDCDGLVDDDDDSLDASTGATFYADGDGDGFGDDAISAQACEAGEGWVSDSSDCDDGDAAVNPGASEQTCNSVDDDCDGATSDTPDADGDGYTVCEDCDDADAAVSPGASEQTCNGVDDDCDSSTSDTPDADGDGYTVCDDCDDADAAVSPGANEQTCNSVDDDCDSSTSDTPDADGDGYTVCDDCDDTDAAVSPGLSEQTCNGVDDDCDSATSDSPDADGDGYTVCTDCDDADAAVSPGANEQTCNGVDDDCDGATSDTPDADGDGASVCDDCDDTDASSYPSAAELCDGVDNDCDGDIDDGVLGTSASCPATSCAEILADNSSNGDGVYSITTNGGDFDVVCDMTEDGGGWTLALVVNSVENGNYALFGSTYEDVADLQIDPATASAASTGVGGWLNINEFSYTTLRLAAYLNGSNTYWSNDIDPAELNVDFGDNGYLLYNDSNGYYWCGGDHSYTDSGSGQVNRPSGAPADCKGHGSLGHGWDFSTSTSANQGLTLCGQYSSWMYGSYGGSLTSYPNAGAAQAIWLR